MNLKSGFAAFLVLADLAFLGIHLQEFFIKPAEAAAPAVRYEYRIVDLSRSYDQDKLSGEVDYINRLARDGWEVCLMSSMGNALYNRVMMRRRLAS